MRKRAWYVVVSNGNSKGLMYEVRANNPRLAINNILKREFNSFKALRGEYRIVCIEVREKIVSGQNKIRGKKRSG